MKNMILSILASILTTTFIIGFFVFCVTSHIELLAISGIPIMLILFYVFFKWLLEEL